MKASSFASPWLTAARRTLMRFGWLPVSVLLIHAVGARVFHAYDRWPPFDIPMHFLGGVAVAYFFSGALAILHSHKLVRPLDALLHLPLVFGLTCAATIFWEFAEWALDRATGYGFQLGLDDTLLDMLLGILGGILFMTWQIVLRTLPDGKQTEREFSCTSS